MSGDRHRDVILEPYVCIFKGEVDLNFILVDSNAIRHKVNMIEYFLEIADTRFVDWPVRSADLNPKEQILDVLLRAIPLGEASRT